MKIFLTRFFSFLIVSFFLSCLSLREVYARTPVEITRSGIIKIAICDDLPPVQFKDNNGGFSGIDPDLGKMIADALGVKPEWKIINSPKYRADMLMSRNVDLVISSFSITKERLEVINLSDPYFTTGLAIMIRNSDRGKIRTYDDLSGKTVVTTKGSAGEKLLFDLGLDARVIPLSDTPSSFDYLIKGQADAVINDRVYLDTYASGRKDLFVLEGTLSANQYGIGVNLQDKELLAFVNNFLNSIRKDGKLKGLVNRYVKGAKDVEVASNDGSEYTIYEVKDNDTLIGLARKFYDDPTKWNIIYSSNSEIIKIASILTPGWKIRIPNINDSGTDSASTKAGVESAVNKAPVVRNIGGNVVSAQGEKKRNKNYKIKEYDLNEIEKYDRTFN